MQCREKKIRKSIEVSLSDVEDKGVNFSDYLIKVLGCLDNRYYLYYLGI